MNYEQAKHVINVWENRVKPKLKTDVNTHKALINRSKEVINQAQEHLEHYETNELEKDFDLGNGWKILKTAEEVVEEMKRIIRHRTADITYNTHLQCVLSHMYNGDLGRATRSFMKYKEFIHEYLAEIEERADELVVNEVDKNLKEIDYAEKEGGYNFLAKNMKETNNTIEKVMTMFEQYLTAREIKQAKKNMRKRKKKKN